jgi:pimeloyl-ACP methyl ester carboxylesterase
MFAGPTSGGGINANDTWVTMNLTFQATMSATLPNSMWSVSQGKYVTTAQYTIGPKHYYLEAGFDTSDLLVINIEPTDAPTDPTKTLYSGVGRITLHGDRLFLYDTSNNPIPVVMPDNAPIPVLNLIGLAPGPSVLKSVITTSPPNMAKAIPGTLSYPQSNLAQILSSAGSSRTKTLTYAQSGSNWILQTVVHTVSSTSHNMTTTTQISNVAWNDNSTGDTRRAAKGYSMVPFPGPGTMTVSASPIPGPTSITPSDQTATGATGANVVFQHGIFSSGQTWNRMVPWLKSDFQFKNVQTPSLNSTDPLSSQATSLIGLVEASGITNNLVIGHSQGGLIARSVAQQNSALFYGVAELDSPNIGALIDYNGMQDIDNALVYEFDNILYDAGCTSPYDAPWCFIAYVGGYYGIPVAVSFGFDTAVPVTTDLQIGSPFLNALNRTTESFPHVGISGHADKRWVLFRLAGDFACYPDDDTCGGRAVADYAEIAYDGLWGLWGYYTFICDPTQYDCADAAAQVMAVINDFDDLDNFWNDLTAGSDSSDGIVQGASQTYPNATQNYVISGADSHVGVTRSPLDRAYLDTALSQQFLTPPLACSYTVAASPTAFAFYGGALTLTVTGSPSNPSTCSWSAVSNAPWMEPWTFPPFGYGWLVDVNLGQDSRSGTLTVAGHVVTVTQSGVAGTVGVGSVSLAGAIPYCDPMYKCAQETISVVVNGSTIAADTIRDWTAGSLLNFPTLNNVSAQIATTINNDANSPVFAGIVGPVVYLVSKNQTGANYPYSVSITCTNCGSKDPVTATTAGPNMEGSQ